MISGKTTTIQSKSHRSPLPLVRQRQTDCLLAVLHLYIFAIQMVFCLCPFCLSRSQFAILWQLNSSNSQGKFKYTASFKYVVATCIWQDFQHSLWYFIWFCEFHRIYLKFMALRPHENIRNHVSVTFLKSNNQPETKFFLLLK